MEGSTEAISLALTNTHYNAEIEHWLLRLLDHTGVDLAAILRHYEVDTGRVAKDLLHAIDGFKRGNARTPAISPDVVNLIKAAWLIASVEYGASKVRSGHLLLALLSDKSLARLGRGASAVAVDATTAVKTSGNKHFTTDTRMCIS